MTESPLGLIVAALGGLAIGLERQWSGHATGPQAHFGGVRTLTLLGGLAGLSGWLWTAHAESLAAVLLAASAALVVVGYLAASRHDVDATTEVSALVVLAAGVLAGSGRLAVASGVIAVATLLLVEKSSLHALAARLDDEGLRAAARFAVMAAVVLPLLPPGPFGPWNTVRPREVWLLVLFFSGLSFTGYVARRAIGARHGYAVAGLIGGLVSSTNVTFTLARASRDHPSVDLSLGVGAVAACTVLFVRVAVAALVINPALAHVLVRDLVPPLLIGVMAFGLGQRASDRQSSEAPAPRNPLQLRAAIQMAALFQAVLIAVEIVRRTWGDVGVVVSGAVLGLTDVDALTFSMARSAGTDIPIAIAARGIATGLTANTCLKLAVALALGTPRFRRIVGVTLAAMAVAMAIRLA